MNIPDRIPREDWTMWINEQKLTGDVHDYKLQRGKDGVITHAVIKIAGHVLVYTVREDDMVLKKADMCPDDQWASYIKAYDAQAKVTRQFLEMTVKSSDWK